MSNPQGGDMNDGYVPTEFTYELSPAPEAVVAFRQEQYLLGNVSKYSNQGAAGQSNEMVFTLTGDQMVDLSSIKLVVDATVYNLPSYQHTDLGDDSTVFMNRWDAYQGAVAAAGQAAADINNVGNMFGSSYRELKGKYNIQMASSMSWFKTLEVKTRAGESIELIQDAVTLGRIVECMSFARSHCDRDGSFHNSEWDPADRNAKWELSAPMSAPPGGPTVANNAVTDLSASCTIEISALKLLGFLNTGKFIKASMFGGQPGTGGGGITFTFTMAEDSKIFTLAKDATTYASAAKRPYLAFENVKLVYDTCIMSDAYTQWFRSTYENRGMRIVFDSYQGYTEVPLVGTTAQSVNLQVQAKRAKALLFVLRWSNNRQLWITNYTAFESEMFRKGVKGASYQLNANGVRYPNTPIDSAAKAHAQLLTVCYARSDVHRDCVNVHEFTNNFSREIHTNAAHAYTTYAYGRIPDAVSFRTCGGFVGTVDFEKYNTSGESGIALSPSSTTLSLQFPPFTTAVHDIEFNAYSANTEKGKMILPAVRNDIDGVASANADTLVLTVFLIRSQAITVANGRVLLDY